MTAAWLPALGLVLLVPLLLWLRQNMIVVLGVAAAWLYYFYSNGAVGNVALDAWQNARNDTFLAIPLYVLAGNVMANGSMATRTVRMMSALTAPRPGGRAVSANGETRLLWNGRSQNGTALPIGAYNVELTARGEDGELIVEKRPLTKLQ